MCAVRLEYRIGDSEGEDTSWISWFCTLRGNEFFCEINDGYIQDDFNLCGLSNQVSYYDYALDLILDIGSSNGEVFTQDQNELIESSAEMLYGLIHALYILTSKGLPAMLEKLKNYDFGRCPQVYCCGVISPHFDVGVKEIESWTARLLPSRQVLLLRPLQQKIFKTVYDGKMQTQT